MAILHRTVYLPVAVGSSLSSLLLGTLSLGAFWWWFT